MCVCATVNACAVRGNTDFCTFFFLIFLLSLLFLFCSFQSFPFHSFPFPPPPPPSSFSHNLYFFSQMSEKEVKYSSNKVEIKTADLPPSYDNALSNDSVAKTPPISKLRIIKNALVLSFGFLCLFTSFQALMNLQSTLNQEGDVGLISTAVIYAALILSCLFLPPPIISFLGCKWTVALSMITYTIYVAGNFYPKMWMMVVVSAIVGFGAAPLWSAKCAYLTEVGIWYARLKNIDSDSSINHFFGVFFMIFQSCEYNISNSFR